MISPALLNIRCYRNIDFDLCSFFELIKKEERIFAKIYETRFQVDFCCCTIKNKAPLFDLFVGGPC